VPVDLQGRVAVVTGGGTGIGRATALALARHGASVAINYSRSEADAVSTAQLITGAGGQAITVQADVSDEGQVLAMFERVASAFGSVDLLVNNAGITRYIPLADLDSVTDEIWDSIFAVNLKGVWYCSRGAAPYMRARGAGAIVNVTSVGGLSGDGSSLPYAVSKAAAIGLTRSLARALAPQIRVCSVAPGIVKTRWVAGREEHVDRLSKNAPLQRTATPEDVAAMIYALLTQDAMTGQTVVVDGGSSL
jgi:3-oxoacyl-[acyl-carrier protein] reductase